MTGRIDEGTARIESALRNIERYGEYGFRCNALVTRGGLLEAQRDLSAAERSYLQAIDVAQAQGALSLELRAARLAAALMGRTQRVEQGRSLLEPIVDRFESGLQSVDLRLAREWMQAAQDNR